MPVEKDSDYYLIGGLKYPRVTKILDAVEKPGLARWRGWVGNQEADRVGQEARQFGTDFHKLVAGIHAQDYTKRGWCPPECYREMAYAYIDWMHENVAEIIQFEDCVYSEEHLYAGTPDLVARFRDTNTIDVVDLKTSNKVGLEWPLQLAAYRRALRERGVEVEGRRIIRIPKNQSPCKPEMFVFSDHEGDDAVWLHVLEYWKWAKGHGARYRLAKAA